ncbi:uncharacterized protein LTR77_003080 [Saxophila tyrrhenica]|uniref:Cytochrome P450 n=1 Tax=Saxophila tyrrhenica TaxID=1690608 RepID=A0AAV9PKM8_9PEZI|nr:hypothetical protein LTR77_003080 [Saxophila tyrrhenica]
MPTRDAHLQFEKWAREYGDIYSLMLGTKTLIVLSSDDAVKELLDRRSGIYSSRQEMYIGQDLCSNGLRLLMMIRKMVHQLLNVQESSKYVPYQMLENKQMLNDLLDTPDRFLHHIRRYSNALTTSMVFGWRTPTYENVAIKQLFEGFNEFAEINQTGTAALIDFFPFLRQLPDFILPAQKKAKEMHKRERELYLGHWLRAKNEWKDGTIKNCFCVGMAQAQEKEQFSDPQAAYISGTLLEAGSDTTSSTLYAFVQAMLLYPETQRLAQEQIDKVVGVDRMPTMQDEPNLPYIKCLMKETLRWMPTTILGAVPHAVTQDDSYKGYLIPKGAGVMNNVWAIHHDPKRSPDPRKFDPNRRKNPMQTIVRLRVLTLFDSTDKDDHLSLYDSASNPDGTKRDQFTFGAGRRICPGMHVAERSLFLGMARMLWAFDITPAMDASGQPIIPDQDKLTQGFVCMPEEYPATITPRSKARADRVRSEWQHAQQESLDPATQQWLSSPV